MARLESTSPRPLTKAEVKYLRSLSTRKGREQAGHVLVEGWKAVDELLRSSWKVESLIVDLQRVPPTWQQMFGRAAERSVEVRSGSAADMRAVSDVREDQGIVAVAVLPSYSVQNLPKNGDVLVLDGVSDPGNVGTLIRTAAWFGLTAVILGPGCASAGNPKVLRATMGSLFHLPFVEVENLSSACRSLALAGITLVSAEVEGGAWPRWAPPGRVALILGSEAHGVSPEVRGIAGRHVSIPRGGRAESLNVAAAGAILLSSLSEQRDA